jgi:hypothetical protein
MCREGRVSSFLLTSASLPRRWLLPCPRAMSVSDCPRVGVLSCKCKPHRNVRENVFGGNIDASA